MQNPGNYPGEFSLSDAIRMTNTPAAQKLLQLLRQTGGNELQEAIAKASAGDYSQAKKTIAALLDNPEVKNHLDQMGR